MRHVEREQSDKKKKKKKSIYASTTITNELEFDLISLEGFLWQIYWTMKSNICVAHKQINSQFVPLRSVLV